MVSMGCSICGFIWKKAIAIKSTAIHIRTKPITGIIAPARSSNPAVPNKPTFDLAETRFRDLQVKKAAIMKNIHMITRIDSIGPRKGTMSAGFKFVVAVKFGSVDQSPVKPG